MPTCAFCKTEALRLVKAHVIPRSFFKAVKGHGKYSVAFEARPEGVTARAKQAGIYDPNILCQQCETRFGPLDHHGFEVLAKTRGTKDAIVDQGVTCGFQLGDGRYDLLKRFILSVLWRAHVSGLPFFADVRLGVHEGRIRDLLFSNTYIDQETYSVVFIAPLGQRYPNTILPPHHARVCGIHFYRLYLPNLTILIKVDQRRTPAPLDSLQLRPNWIPFVVFQPYRGSHEEQFFEGLNRFMRKHRLFEK